MDCKVRLVLEINGEIVTERYVKPVLSIINEIKQRWFHTYAIKARKLPYQIYVEIASEMESTKVKRKPFINNKINYETNETIADCKG